MCELKNEKYADMLGMPKYNKWLKFHLDQPFGRLQSKIETFDIAIYAKIIPDTLTCLSNFVRQVGNA